MNKSYIRKVSKILKVYNSILVKCKNIPILTDKNIIIVECMDGMINTQVETRKPILYIQQQNSITFFLIDGTEAYIYIIKQYKDAECIVENILCDLQSQNKLLAKNWNEDFVYDENRANKNNCLSLIPQKNRLSFLKWIFKKKSNTGKRAKTGC